MNTRSMTKRFNQPQQQPFAAMHFVDEAEKKSQRNAEAALKKAAEKADKKALDSERKAQRNAEKAVLEAERKVFNKAAAKVKKALKKADSAEREATQKKADFEAEFLCFTESCNKYKAMKEKHREHL